VTIAIRRPITVLAACAAVGALVTGCGAGPGGTAAQISSAALVGGHPVSLQTVQQNITDVLAEHGIVLPTSCEQGVCGTCLTRVLEGEIDHRDVFLTEAEQAIGDQMTPCCSRAKGALLVLDL